jgi:drug/metabolite transporter (DMT)-like permease
LGIIGFNFLLYEALQYTTSMNASLISSINPVIIVLFSSLLLKERISFRSGIGLLISLLGVLIVLTQGKLQHVFHMNFNKGDIFVLGAILVWTFYSILGKNMKSIPPISATAVSVVFGLLMMLPFVMVSGIPYPLSNQSIMGLLYFGIFPSVASFIFWNVALRHTDASRAGIYINFIPVFTAVINLVLEKTINFIQVVGGIFVFIGVYLTSKKRNKNSEGSLAARSLREADEQVEIEESEEKHTITHH